MFLRHDECPSCGSSDNLAVYESREFPGYETSNCMTPGCSYKVTDFDIQKTNPNLAVAPMEKKSRISPKADVVLKGWENAQPAYEMGHGSKAVVDHFDIRFDAAKNKILYPIKTQTGELVAIKTRSLTEKAFATYYLTDTDSPALFGLNTLSSKWQVLLTEGEKDATAVKEMLGSASVISIRSANTALKDVRSIYPILVDLEADVFLCFDNDEAGAIATAEVYKAFPTFKVVGLPTGCKDAHEAFMKGLTKKFKDAIYAAEKQKPQCLESKSDVRAKAIERASRTASECMGWSTGIGQLDALIGGLREHELTLIFGGSGLGKAVALDTEIPTPDGLRLAKDIKQGDSLYDAQGKPTKVVWVSPVWNDTKTYKVTFSTNESVVVSEQHLWAVSEAKDRKRYPHKPLKVVATKDMISNLRTFNARKALNYAVPMSKPVEGSDKVLPIHPYVLGYWLGDGTSDGGSITTADTEVVARIESLGYKCTKWSKPYAYNVIGLSKTLRLNNLLQNKHIPNDYLNASVEQRMELVRGLMDSDGDLAKTKRDYCFSNCNKTLADDFVTLINSLGVRATRLTQRAKLYGKDCGEAYRVTFSSWFQAATLDRKLCKAQPNRFQYRYIKTIEEVPSVPTVCFEVDNIDHLFLVTRYHIPTHNSQASRQITMSLLKQGLKTLVVTSEEGHDKWTCELARSRYGLSNPGDATNVIKFLDTYGDDLDYMKVSGLNTKNIDEWLVKVKASMIAMQSKVLVFDNITHVSDLISSASSWEITYKISLALSDFARDNDIHVIVVGHVLKMNNEIGDVPTIAKFKGGSSPNYFHNILGIFIPEDDTKLRNVVLVKRRETPIGLTTSLGDVVSMTYDPNFGNYVSEKSNGQPARITDSAGMQALKASRKPLEAVPSDSASVQEPQPRLPSNDPQGQSDNAGIERRWKCDGNPISELVGDVEISKDSEDLARLPSTDRDDSNTDEVNWGDFMPAIAI